MLNCTGNTDTQDGDKDPHPQYSDSDDTSLEIMYNGWFNMPLVCVITLWISVCVCIA